MQLNVVIQTDDNNNKNCNLSRSIASAVTYYRMPLLGSISGSIDMLMTLAKQFDLISLLLARLTLI